METLERVAVATVGYEGRSLGEVVDLLRESGITLLVDVRLTPWSRKPGFTKDQLAGALRSVGLEYRHRPVLGNPRDNRDGYRRSEPEAHEVFRSSLRRPAARASLDQLVALAEVESIALMCFERDATTCHRSLVVEALQDRNQDIVVRHL